MADSTAKETTQPTTPPTIPKTSSPLKNEITSTTPHSSSQKEQKTSSTSPPSTNGGAQDSTVESLLSTATIKAAFSLDNIAANFLTVFGDHINITTPVHNIGARIASLTS